MEANFGQLIDMCNKVGWEVGIKELEKIIYQQENAQVFLQEQGRHKQAAKMTPNIIKQKFAVAKLKNYRKEHAL
jgi:hypothetical protein